MGTSCPFMALQTAMDKAKGNHSPNRALNLSCPFSGRQLSVATNSVDANDNCLHSPSYGDETRQDHRISQWMRQVPRSASPLGAISEDIESRGVDEQEQRSTLGRQSLAGSLRSLHSVQSVISGLHDPNLPGSSRYCLSVIFIQSSASLSSNFDC